MDNSDVHKFEFLDLSEVDEIEKNQVLACLKYYGPIVQLPWISCSLNDNSTGIKQKRPDVKYVVKSPPAAAVVIGGGDSKSQIPHETHQELPAHAPANAFVTYNNNYVSSPSSLPSPQQASNHVTKFNNNSNFNNNLSSTLTFETVEHNNSIVPQQSSSSSCDDNSTNVGVDDLHQNAADTEALPPSTPVQNGLHNKHSKSDATSPSPANKSWASLFNSSSKIVENGNNGYDDSNVMTKNAFNNQAVNSRETNNNSNSSNLNGSESGGDGRCPIKFPRAAQFVDPDCHRIGEYLQDYTLDGRAVSLQPRGLINQSNYCYINSILQALLACPPVYNLISGISQHVSTNNNDKRNPTTPVIDGMCRFVKEFKQLPAGQRVNRRSVDKNQKSKEQGVIINYDIPFEPFWIYKMLNGIRTDLMEGRQEDAEEFLGCLLNGLNDEMLELIKLVKGIGDVVEKPPVVEVEQDLDKEWQVIGPKNKGSVTRRTDFGNTPISDIFGGFLKSRIHRTGDLSTENIQPFFTLQLNIEKVKTVREALEALVTKNQLEGVTSSKTNEEVEAWQQVMLDELPVVLILHLKCFDYKLDGCSKILKALEFPIDLKMDAKWLSSKTNTAKEKQYKLFAVVYHDGKEATKGHYVTDAFHVGYSSWLRYDDASVKAVQEEHVLKPLGTRVPYLLFYRRSDTIRSK